MTRKWSLIAEALNLDIPEENLAKLQPALDALEAAFRPLLQHLPHETEPAVMFHCRPEEKP
jgi:hypothetical protein